MIMCENFAATIENVNVETWQAGGYRTSDV